MLQSDKIALHYEVIANTASKIEKVSKELSTLYDETKHLIGTTNDCPEYYKTW